MKDVGANNDASALADRGEKDIANPYVITLSSSLKMAATPGVTYGEVTWVADATGGATIGNYQSSYTGQQFGTSSTQGNVTFTTSDISGTITSIVVSSQTGISGGGTVAVSVGGTAYGEAQAMKVATSGTDSTPGDLTFNGSSSGEIVITMTQTKKKALYLNSITVNYSTGGTTYSVSYNANGATSGEVPTDGASYSSGATVTVKGNTGDLAKTGYAFTGWNTEAGGGGTSYAPGETFAISANTTLYAQWEEAWEVTFMTNGHLESTMNIVKGNAIATMPTPTEDFLPTGYNFKGWYAGDYAVNNTPPASYVTAPYTPTSDIILKAVFAEITTPASYSWAIIDNLSTVTEGTYAIINNEYEAFNGTISSGHGQVTATAFDFSSGNPTSAPEGTCILVLATSESGFTMYNSEKGYLYASKAASGGLAWHATEDSYWYCGTLYTESNDWCYAKDYSSKKAVLRNYSNSSFRTYASNSGTLIKMAKRTTVSEEVYGNYRTAIDNIYTNVTTTQTRDSDIPNYEIVTVANGAILTLNGDNLGDENNIIIEDGGQLIHASAVKATLKKEVVGYTGNDNGWYTIASPVASANVSLATTGTYDLYAYDETKAKWLNQKVVANSITNFAANKGYLYANNANKTLSFAGSMRGTSSSFTINLSWTCSIASVKGFNLVSNPFSRNITSSDVTLAESPLATYYVVEGGGELVARTLSSNPIKPGQGFFVQATAASQQLKFNSAKGETATKPAFICIEAGNEGFMDCAYVQIGQGNTLRKMTMNENVPHVYVMNNGKDYAAATIENATGEIPVGFNAAYNGIYTINVNPKGLEADYLHLIDKVTGADIDLLTTPSYSFEANTGNNANRFRLVFAANDVDEYSENTSFAYFNGSEWVIENDGQATLQVIDVMGRMLRNEIISGNAITRTDNLSAGVYVMRLVNGEKVKTQKIVVEQ